MVIQRRRFKQTLSPKDRLAIFARAAREKASHLPPEGGKLWPDKSRHINLSMLHKRNSQNARRRGTNGRQSSPLFHTNP